MAREQYEIELRSSGARELKRNLDDIAGSAKTATNSFSRMQNAISFAFSVYGLATLKGYVDGYANIISKLRIATDSAEGLARAEANLFAVSQRTYSGFEETVDLYGRLERSTRELGVSQDALLQVTETVNKAIQLSGASTQAANASIIQLGQGLAAGALRGDELRSVLEQTPALAQAIANGMGVAVGDLKRLGEEGELTTQRVLNAIAKTTEMIDEEFKNIPMTISRGWTNLTNAIQRTVGQLDQELGVSSAIGRGLTWVGENLDNIAMASVSAAASIGLLYAPQVITGIKVLSVTMANAWKVAAANPFIALAGVLATVVTGFLLLKDTIYPIEGSIANLGDVVEGTFNVIVQKNADMIQAVATGIGKFASQAGEWLSAVTGIGQDTLNSALGYAKRILNGFIGVGAAIIAMPQAIMGSWEANIDRAIGNAASYFLAFSQDLQAIGEGDFSFTNLETARKEATGGFEQMSFDIKATLAEAFDQDYVGAFIDLTGEGVDAIKQRWSDFANEVIAESERVAAARIAGEEAAQVGYEKTDVILQKEIKTQRQLQDELLKANKARMALLGELQGFEGNYSYTRQIEIIQLWKSEQLEAIKKVGGAHEELASLIDEVVGKKIEAAYEESLAASKDWGDGIKLTLLEFSRESANYAELAQGSIDSFVDNSVNAIAEFARTGKLDFGDFAAAVAADILMMTTRMLIMKAVMASIGYFSGGGQVGDGVSTMGGFGNAQYAAGGGEIHGIGSGTSDSIPVWVGHGEYIVNAQSTKQHRALLEAINSGQMKRYASGGYIGSTPMSDTSGGSRQGGMSIDASQTLIIEGDASEKTVELMKQAMAVNKQEVIAEIMRQFRQNGPMRDIMRG